MRTTSDIRRITALLSCLAALLLLATACSNTSRSSGAIGQLAAQVPASGEPFTMLFSNYESAMDQLGNRAPGTCENAADRDDYVNGLFDAGLRAGIAVPDLFISGVDAAAEAQRSFGFGFCEMSAAAFPSILGRSENNSSAVYFGVTRTASEIDAVLNADPIWGDDVNAEEVDGATLYDWGDDINMEQRSLIRPLGRGGQLAVGGGGVVVRTTARAEMDVVLGNSAQRLTDLPHVAEAFNQLESSGAFSIEVTNQPVRISDGLTLESLNELGAEPLEQWELAAIGVAVDDEGGRVEIVLGHANQNDARTNGERLASNLATADSWLEGQPWSDVFAVEHLEVDGVVVRASLRVISEDGKVRMPSPLDTLFIVAD